MGKKGRTSSRNQRASVASCAICGAPCIPDIESAQKHVRCTQCGETYALVLTPVAREGWTVIDPKGNVASFDDSESARKSMPGGRLVLEPQSDPDMARAPEPERIDTPIQGTAVVEPAVARPSQPPTIRPPMEEGSDSWLVTRPPSSTAELVAEELVESLPSEVSIKALSDRADKAADSGNPVSLDDVLEMMPAPRASKAPPLPSRAPPKSPVTIPAGSLEPRAPRPSEDDEANGGPRVVVASAVAATPRIPVGLKKPVTVAQAEPEYPDDDDEPRKTASVRETLDEGQGSGRGWMIAVAVFAVLGIGFFAYARSDSAPAKPGPTPAQTTSVATTPPASAAKVVTAPSASVSAAPPASAVASTTPSAAPSASVAAPSASVASVAPAGGGGGGEPAASTAASDNPNQPIPDVLHAAHAAIRKGDAAGAQRHFERVLGRDPNNVEAIAGLGDIARAAGDTAKAKSSYEAALAKAPHYVPAQLALADIKWDTGEKSDAIARYAAIVEKLGDAAPSRAKERANQN